MLPPDGQPGCNASFPVRLSLYSTKKVPFLSIKDDKNINPATQLCPLELYTLSLSTGRHIFSQVVWRGLKMGKTKMEMKRVQNPSRRQVTFSIRKKGLLKKAFELSVLCDAEVALIIFSETGKICEFASHGDMATLLEKYRIHNETAGNPGPMALPNIKFGHSRLKRLHERMELLERKERNMVGEDMESLTIKELHQLEKQLQIGIKKICDRKVRSLEQEKIELQSKVHSLEQEKIELQSKVRSLEQEKIELQSKLGTGGDSSTSATDLHLGLSYRSMPTGLCDGNRDGDCFSNDMH